jgi:hypothetical protein
VRAEREAYFVVATFGEQELAPRQHKRAIQQNNFQTCRPVLDRDSPWLLFIG